MRSSYYCTPGRIIWVRQALGPTWHLFRWQARHLTSPTEPDGWKGSHTDPYTSRSKDLHWIKHGILRVTFCFCSEGTVSFPVANWNPYVRNWDLRSMLSSCTDEDMGNVCWRIYFTACRSFEVLYIYILYSLMANWRRPHSILFMFFPIPVPIPLPELFLSIVAIHFLWPRPPARYATSSCRFAACRKLATDWNWLFWSSPYFVIRSVLSMSRSLQYETPASNPPMCLHQWYVSEAKLIVSTWSHT